MSKPKKPNKADFPSSPAIEFLEPWIGSCNKPTTTQGKLLEALDSRLVCGAFSGFEQGARFVASTLGEWEVALDSNLGQCALEHFVEKAVRGEYGDFERWITCESCLKEFRPAHSLTYAKQMLSVGALCPSCLEDPKRHITD